MPVTRRNVLIAGSAAGAFVASGLCGAAMALSDGADIVESIIGAPSIESERVRLQLPAVFPNGATVPVLVDIDTAMTATDHVRRVRLLAPRNPIVEIMSLHFEPQLSLPRVSARIRLAEPQFVIAIAEMNNGASLMAKQFVEVDTNGCPSQ
jgi:sulfur-oxidizing protein SoxY